MNESVFSKALADVSLLRSQSPELAKLVTVVTRDSSKPSLKDLRVPDAYGAIVTSKAASLWPYKLISGLLERLLSKASCRTGNTETNLADEVNTTKRTFNLQTNTPATHLQSLQNGSWIIHTPRGMVSTQKILLATNAYTSHLLPDFSDLIVPVRGEMSALVPPPALRPTSESALTGALEYSYGFVGNGKQNINQDDYLIQRPFYGPTNTTAGHDRGGELMFGGGRSYASEAGIGIWDDSEIDPPVAKYLRKELITMFSLDSGNGEGKEFKAKYEWSGIMGYSRDGRPWVGEVPGKKGVWVCAGFTGHGMPNGTLCGRAAAKMIKGVEREEIDLPEEFDVSEERMGRARMELEVRIADEMA